MKVDFSKFTSVVSGSMKTAKAELRFYSPSGVVRKEQLNDGAAKTALVGNAANRLTETKEQLKQMEEKISELKNRMDDTAGTAQPERQENLSKGKKIDDSFSVSFQFNPAALRISAYGGGMAPITSYGSEDGSGNGDEEKRAAGRWITVRSMRR